MRAAVCRCNRKEKYKMNERSIHPYKAYIPERAEKLIIGTIPPYRFCCGEKEKLYETDVDFYYGSRDNYFWDIMSDITGVKLQHINSEEAVQKRKELLNSLNVGITDIIESCIHKDGKSDDASLCDIKTKDIALLLSEHQNINELIYTSRFVIRQMNESVKTNHSWSNEKKLDGSIVINGKKYNVRVLYSPSPQALRSITKEDRLERYKIVFGL